ncbi:MAG: pyrimidine 5'-nucleotidase [Anaerolineae bacterium]|nr:pyrimidine 5'-nucleotidase [Anaerolineae bacterium]
MMRVNDRGINYILFDLDETLYPKETGLMDVVNQRINDYMRLRLGIPVSQVLELRERYYRRYGTTSRGLYRHHHLDVHDYLVYVHDLPVEEYLLPDPFLDEVLGSIEAEKAVFTNSPRDYVQRVLRALGVERHFDRIFDIYFLEQINKPDKRAYLKVIKALETDGQDCLIVDDLATNLKPGKELGMVTVLVGDDPKGSLWEKEEGVDFVIPRVTELGRIMKRA